MAPEQEESSQYVTIVLKTPELSLKTKQNKRTNQMCSFVEPEMYTLMYKVLTQGQKLSLEH